eukprot:2108629-Alexandrium_andersonii.AAC.1
MKRWARAVSLAQLRGQQGDPGPASYEPALQARLGYIGQLPTQDLAFLGLGPVGLRPAEDGALIAARLLNWPIDEVAQMIHNSPVLARRIVQAMVEETWSGLGHGGQRRRAPRGTLGAGGPARWNRL